MSNEARGIRGTWLHTRLGFDEGTGTSAADSSGNGRGATLVAGAAWALGVSGQGTALALNGNGGYATLPANIVDTVGDFTITAWVYWKGGQSWSRIFDFGSNPVHYMFLSPQTGGGKMAFAATLNGSEGELRLEAPSALPAMQWVHVALTLAGTDLTLYLNGQAVATAQNFRFPPFQLGHTTQNYIGRSQYAGDPAFNGMIDDFRIYHGAASAADIQALGTAPLPSPMFGIDIGAVALRGSASLANGVYTVAGSGADIWSTADAFHFACANASGDGSITARVTSITNTSSWAKAGVMMRASRDSTAPHVLVAVSPGNGVQMMYRGAAGASSSNVRIVAGIKAPCWVRLTRAGNTFTGYISPDGASWTLVGSISVPMPAAVFSGLAVLSHDNPALNTATFDNVSYA